MPSIQMHASIINGTPEDKDKLPQIISDHKEWLKDHMKGKKACLRDMNLTGADLSGIDLSYVDISGAYLWKAKFVGTTLTGAVLIGADMTRTDFSRATLDGAQMTQIKALGASFEGASMKGVILRSATLWDTSFKGADMGMALMTGLELCDCILESANLTFADLTLTDLDNAVFKNANLKYARIEDADRSYWADFRGADVTGVEFSGCEICEESFEGAIGFHPHMRCPEEGSFIAWKKYREDRIVKLLIPENARRTGASTHSCRASEAVVMEIRNQENESCEEAVSLRDEEIVYRKGAKVYPKEAFDDHLLIDGSGIHFFLTRTEAEQFEFPKAEDGENEEDEAEDD